MMDRQQQNSGPCSAGHQKRPEKEVSTNSLGQGAEDHTQIPTSVPRTADPEQKKSLLSPAHQEETKPCPTSPSTSETDEKEISMSLSQEKEDSDPGPCSEEEHQQQTLGVAEDPPHGHSQGEEPQPPLPDPSQDEPSEQQQQQQGGSVPVDDQKFLKEQQQQQQEQQQYRGGEVPVKHQMKEQQHHKSGKVPVKNQKVPQEKQQQQQKQSDDVSEGQQQQQQQHRKTSATSSWQSRQTTLNTSKACTEASSGSAASKNDSAHSQTQRQQKQPPPPLPPPPPPRPRSTSIPRPTRTLTTTPTPRLSTRHHHHPTHLHQNRHTFPKTPRESLPSLRPTSGWPVAVPPPKPFRYLTPFSSSSSSFTPPRRLYKDNNPDFFLKDPYVPPAFRNACEDLWRWSARDKSPEVRLKGMDRFTAVFHPNWSNGTIGVRGTKPINHGVHYWEIQIPARIFGTSMMFGIATKKARLHVDSFLNLIGEDGNGWGLSHKGLAWHGGRSYPFCPAFTENVAVRVGLVYDSTEGTLTYYKNGECLGVAFRGLNAVEEDLYPAVCSTAAKTEMTLGVTRRAYVSLQDQCRAAIIRQLKRTKKIPHVTKLPLPRILCRYVIDEVPLRLMW